MAPRFVSVRADGFSGGVPFHVAHGFLCLIVLLEGPLSVAQPPLNFLIDQLLGRPLLVEALPPLGLSSCICVTPHRGGAG